MCAITYQFGYISLLECILILSEQMFPNMAVAVYRSVLESQTLFDFQYPLDEDVWVLSDTTLLYGQKYHESPRRKRIKAVKKEEAMNGIMPGYEYQLLFSLRKIHKGKISFQITPSEVLTSLQSNCLRQKAYICLNRHGRQNQLPEYEIVEGDTIKLGDLQFEVIETHESKDKNNIQSIKQQQSKQDIAQKKLCKICLMQGDEDNDLISPCHCKGSCEFVHINCLKTWVSSKVRKQYSNLVSTYFLPKMECQICKKPLPSKAQVGIKSQSLVQFDQGNIPYIVLQRLNLKKSARQFFILKPNEASVKIGSGIGMNLRLRDSTVSQSHCSISFRNNKFYLKDEGSQYGSLIHLKKAVIVDKIMCIQVGVKVIKFEQLPIPNLKSHK